MKVYTTLYVIVAALVSYYYNDSDIFVVATLIYILFNLPKKDELE